MRNERYGMLFDTSDDVHYYFDAGTGKVLSCSDKEKELIECILQNKMDLDEVCKSNPEFSEIVSNEDLFSDEEWSFYIPEKKEYIDQLQGKCEQIVIELTEACNLRCGYCIYNEHHPNHRGFSGRNISFDTARMGIDYILRGYKRDTFALTFYGGEPLINFDVLKKCIDYSKKTYGNIELTYGFTTNLTLLTRDMLDYLKTIENIDIVCSLDGPAIYHDKYRKYSDGSGSFIDAIENMNLLVKEFYCPEARRGLSINCVLTPPYSLKKLEEIRDFFYRKMNLPKDISCNYSYVDRGKMVFDETEQQNNKILELSPLEEYAANDFELNKEESDYWKIISVEMSRVANRPVTRKGFISTSHLHGNCIPGQRRVYLTVDGHFKPCEKVGRAPTIGDVVGGYNYDKSYDQYIKKYAEYFQEKCNNCWARTMCGICYESAMDGEGDEPYISGGLCETSRILVKDMFVNYYHLLEKDRDGLKEALDTVKLR